PKRMPMQYPEETITTSQKGRKEVRVLISRGKFVRYNYLDPETGKPAEQGKESILLKSENGEEEHLFCIPLKNGRNILIRKKNDKKRKLWDPKSKKAVDAL
ncbi:hypothetical protein D6745_03100, partial [Candidatus Woesearchaeota archaeon]